LFESLHEIIIIKQIGKQSRKAMEKSKRIVYIPNRHLKLGVKVWLEMLKELKDSRELILRLFIRDFSAKYRQSFLGYLWAVFLPFMAIVTFMFLNRSGILNIGKTDVPYPLFALVGLTVWQLFSTGVVSGTNSLVRAGGMITKINFPRETLVFSSLAQSLFEFIIKTLLIVISFFIFKFVPFWTIVFFPLAVLPILLLTLGLSFIFALVNCLFRDTISAVALIANFLLFLTPVLYPKTEISSFFFKMNPLTALVSAPRDLIIYGYIKEPVDFFLASILAILLFLVSWRVFHITEPKIPERV